MVDGILTDDELKWDWKAVEEWRQLYTILSKNLAALIHWVYGSPARGEEIINTLITNLPNAPRSIHVIFQRLVIMLRYDKTSTSTGVNHLTVRSLPHSVSLLLFRYLAYLRPLETCLLSALKRQPEEISSSASYLFVTNGKRWNSTKFSANLKEMSLDYFGTAFGLEDWRQLAAFVQDFFGAESLLKNALTDPAVRTFVHSLKTHGGHYAVDEDRPTGLSSQEMAAQASASLLWHTALGLDSIHLEALDGSTLPALSSSSDVQVGAPPSPPATSSPRILSPAAVSIGHINDLVVSSRWSRHITKLGFPIFRSTTQAKAVQLISESVYDGFINMRTGGGKSLLMSLPMVEMTAGSVMVIALTNRALRSTLPARLRIDFKDLGTDHKVWVWSDKERPEIGSVDGGVVVVMVEQLVSEGFKRWATHMSDIHRLRCFIIDEAHEILTAQSYRPVMNSIFSVRRHAIPFYLLSATITPRMINQLCDKTIISNPVILRESTARPEISLAVAPVRSKTISEAATMAANTIQNWLNSDLFGSDGKIIVYCRTVANIHKTYARLKNPLAQLASKTAPALIYTGQLNSDDQQSVLGAFTTISDTPCRVIIATSALGLGVDFPLVMGVIYVGSPDHIIALDQGMGRSGRGTRKGVTLIFPIQRDMQEVEQEVEADNMFGHKEMRQMVSGDNRCRRQICTSVLDEAAVSCIAIGAGDMMCDVCWTEAWGGRSRPFWMPDGSAKWGSAQFTNRIEEEGGCPARMIKARFQSTQHLSRVVPSRLPAIPSPLTNILSTSNAIASSSLATGWMSRNTESDARVVLSGDQARATVTRRLSTHMAGHNEAWCPMCWVILGRDECHMTDKCMTGGLDGADWRQSCETACRTWKGKVKFAGPNQGGGAGHCYRCWMPQDVCGNKINPGKPKDCRHGSVGFRLIHTAWFNTASQLHTALHDEFKTEEALITWLGGWDSFKVANPWRLILWLLQGNPNNRDILQRSGQVIS
ncbi:P-loop containing nucleoside triphosphate hydrolase protein [Naematelia encephala]|uniref:DNA 3'-5' helicase n=1 Tax=Naematelia encephala TaxID=71784 RepID=A0A1Y2B7D5_9TREE|nr:P-loop containing nucleoside triphosphate hydrolase protein [Naematelia encephala]